MYGPYSPIHSVSEIIPSSGAISNTFNEFTISVIPFSTFLFWSVSSTLKKNTPFVFLAAIIATNDWYNPPICTYPVGLGANLVTIAPSGKFLSGYFSS